MNLKSFLYPKSIAVIGASKDANKIGYQILNNIVINKFGGDIFPINLKEKEILGFKAYPSILDVGKKIDLVMVVVPADYVIEEVKKCATADIKNIIVISAGFSEAGGVGKLREIKLQELATAEKLNILGPNCFGIINTACNLNATFAKSKNKKGKVAFISQSGAICAAVLDWASDKTCGFSKFISVGNKAVLDENDFFEYFIDDKETDLVIVYSEEIKDGKRFMEAVAKLSKIKPVAILKAGQSEAGATAAMSHTGSMAGSNEAIMAGFRRANVINLENIEEMFDLLLFYGKKRVIKNNQLALVSNAGGPMVATVDALSKKGIVLPEFSEKLAKRLAENLPAIVNIKNPLDLIGDATAERYRAALASIAEDKNISIILVLLTPQSASEVETTARIIVDIANNHKDKIFLTSFIGGASVKEARDIFAANDIAHFAFPNKAADILSKIIAYESGKKTLKAYKRANAVSEIRTKKEQLDYIASFNLLKKYGIPAVKTVKIKTAKDLAGLKYPVALKVVGKHLIHKTEEKAIALNLKNKEEAVKAWSGFGRLLKQTGSYCVAQPMTKGIEMIAGIKKDRSFGHIVVVGMGGIYTEVFKDVQIEVDDVDGARALKMIEKLKMYPILKGARGQRGFDMKGIVKVITGLAKLAATNEKIQEIDINPMFVTEKGVFAADVRIIF